ncbi:MAG: hypothetical protein KGD63_01220 [Candidatus Lokiarchaeota archaeon]|nr:hypothetical protein [Candidatus Lokiarchaeota archaeon]
MSKEYIKGQIDAKEAEINRIEEEASNKIASTQKEIEEKYDSDIEEVQSKLEAEEQLRDEAISKAEEWTQKKIEKIASAKVVSKKLSLLKNQREKALNAELKEINNNKNVQIKEVQREIKDLNKKISNLERAQAI